MQQVKNNADGDKTEEGSAIKSSDEDGVPEIDILTDDKIKQLKEADNYYLNFNLFGERDDGILEL